jgi:hypothetical protein
MTVHRDKRILLAGYLLLAAVWAIWCAFFLAKGLDFTDEGVACSDAWRLAQGDLPFRDTPAYTGLSSWLLSGVFHVHPDCGLLGLRIVWAVVMMLCAFLTARIMLRHFNPLVSFAGTAAALFFVTGGVYRVLSYNSMPVPFLLLAALLWLDAHHTSGRRQVLMACGAGIAAFIATACRLSLLPIVLLPLLTIVYDHYCGAEVIRRWRVAGAFTASYLAGVACFFLTLGVIGVVGDFGAGLGETGAVPGHSLYDMLGNAALSVLFFLAGAMSVLVPVLLLKRRRVIELLSGGRRAVVSVVSIIALLGLSLGLLQWSGAIDVAGWFRDAGGRVLDADPPHKLVGYGLAVGLSVGVILVAMASRIFRSHGDEPESATQGRYRLALVALFLSLLMILGTNNVPAYSLRYVSWLPICAAVGLVWLWITENAGHRIGTRLASAAKVGVLVFLVLCVLYGVDLNRYPYRSGHASEQVAALETGRLDGVLTTTDRARTVDLLVEAVQSNSEPGDRILAYENLPMLYFAADRLPAADRSWVSENFDRSLRESIPEDMIARGRIPALVIRATYTTRDPAWPTVRAPLEWSDGEQETDPIDRYVREHYEVIDVIDGFEIMLRAQ